MKKILVKSYAKINLSLDVLGLLENGYHEVSMVMQQLQLADDVLVRWYDGSESAETAKIVETAETTKTAESTETAEDFEIEIEVSTNRKYLPTDERNIAYKAAKLMIEEYGAYAWGKGTATSSTAKFTNENKVKKPQMGRLRLDTDDDSAEFANKDNARIERIRLENINNNTSEFANEYGTKITRKGKIRIDIKKVIPVAAGLAGGSGNAAAVLCALNRLWNLDLSLDRLCQLGAKLGADVPFCVLGQAYGNHFRTPSPGHLPPAPDTPPGRPAPLAAASGQAPSGSCSPVSPALDTPPGRPAPLAAASGQAPSGSCSPVSPAPSLYPTSCALAYGTGTDLLPLPPLNAWIVLSKPPISVSTAEIYKAFDSLTKEEIGKRPENERIMEALKRKKMRGIEKNMANVLEKAAIKRYSLITETKKAMKAAAGKAAVMMSGSGPTVFAILYSKSEALRVYEKMKKINNETYLTHTLITGKKTRNFRP